MRFDRLQRTKRIQGKQSEQDGKFLVNGSPIRLCFSTLNQIRSMAFSNSRLLDAGEYFRSRIPPLTEPQLFDRDRFSISRRHVAGVHAGLPIGLTARQ